MDWITRLNEAMGYIEENLTGEIELDRMAQIAACSPFHFQRMFTYIAGIPLSEYIRRRRMTAAACDLLQTDEKIVNIALKYGYASPTAFNRAFQSVHGVSPSAARGSGVALTAYSRITFSISIIGDTAMNYRIESKDAFRIVGQSVPLEKDVEINFENVPKLWAKVASEGFIPKLCAVMDGEPQGIIGASLCGVDGTWRYYIAGASKAPLTEGMEEVTVPATQWAIFPGTGEMPKAIQDLEKRIITEWLPTSGYEYGNAPDIELYLNADTRDAVFEVWIPVVKSEKQP